MTFQFSNLFNYYIPPKDALGLGSPKYNSLSWSFDKLEGNEICHFNLFSGYDGYEGQIY